MDESLLATPVMVPGGRGCLAGVLGRHLAAQGARVTQLSRTSGDGFLDLEDFLAGRVAAPGGALLHLAWSTVPYTAEPAGDADQTANLALLDRVLARLAAEPVGKRPHLVFFSSGGGVYGDARPDRPHREDDPCAPIGRHGQAKLAAERRLAQASAEFGLSWTILRVSNPYGFPVPAQRAQGIIPIAIHAARTGRPLTLWGDGTARKDFLHHSDFCRAVGLVIQRRPAGIFNVCSGESHSVAEIIALVEQATGRALALTRVPAQPWDVHNSHLDGAKLRAATGWQPLMSLAEGIRRTAADLSSP